MGIVFGLARTRVNGTMLMAQKICLLFFEKMPRRPPKSRKKKPHEVPSKNGPRLSKHGVVIHCTFCGEANHNVVGCKIKKWGFSVTPKNLILKV
jgi:hypothetical protein